MGRCTSFVAATCRPPAMPAPALVWLRNDRRLADNPALVAAAQGGRPVVPVFVLDDAAAGAWPLGGAARRWLHHSLASLGTDLAERGPPLVLCRGDSLAILQELVTATGAAAVYWNRRHEPSGIAQDKVVKAALRAHGLAAQSFKASLMLEPWEVLQDSGAPYKVYTPYSRAWSVRLDGRPPLPAPM